MSKHTTPHRMTKVGGNLLSGKELPCAAKHVFFPASFFLSKKLLTKPTRYGQRSRTEIEKLNLQASSYNTFCSQTYF